MSSIPTPLGSNRSGSRLPNPISAPNPVPMSSSTSMLKPPTSVVGLGNNAASKRPRADPEDGNVAKRQALQRSKTSMSQSMMHLPTVGTSRAGPPAAAAGRGGGAIKKPTGIAPGRISGTRAPVSRPAMGDRTNVSRAASTLSLNSTVASSTTTEKKGPASKSQKHAPWDLKGRLEDIEALLTAKDQHLATVSQQNTILKTEKEEKETIVALNSQDLEAARAECQRLRQDLQAREDEVRHKNRQIEDLTFSKSSLERRQQETFDELSAKQAELAGLRTTVAELSSASAGMEAKLKCTQMELEKAVDKISVLERLCAEQKEAIDTFMEKQRTHETERRKLHNTILELKGNIRVFCRVRPLLGSEVEKFDPEMKHIVVSEDKTLDIVKPTESPAGSTAVGKIERHQFDFDHVFGADTNQETVFEEVSQLVQSAIDGYNVCIFAYGQTGSGKTFTMEGGDDNDDDKHGIIPRTIRKIYEETSNLKDKGWTYKMEASFLEIYNEEIRDLLATEKGLKYEIRKVDTKSNDVYVSNLKIEDVTNGSTILNLLSRAKKNRIVAATNCNERSSRSHSVFILKICGHNSITSEACTGTLNLVDLAGSERLKESGSTGLRLEETKNINSSLSNLSKVIMALASNKDGHIPYRDSKLTHLLMNSLGGNSKTLMFVNLSPREDYINETLNSLRFAKRVNQCQIGTASKKVHSDLK